MSVLPGEEIWRFQEGSAGSFEAMYAGSADADGNFFLAGKTTGSIDGVIISEGEDDLAAIKLDTDGDLLWSWQAGSTGDEAFWGAAATDDGGVVLGGYYNGTYNGVTSEGLTDLLAVKLDADGNVEWQWQEGTDADEEIKSCSVTADGNVVLSGFTEGSWYGDNPGFHSIIAVKLDVTDGSIIWRYQAGLTSVSAISFAAAPRSDGSIVLAGVTDGDWDGSLSGYVDLCAVALDEDGAELWRWQDGVSYGTNYAYGVTALSDDSVVLVGYTDADYAVLNSGGEDFVAVKLLSSGVTDWSWQSGTEYDDQFTGVATGIDGASVVMTGYTFGSWVETQAGDEEDIDMVGMSIDTDGNILWTYQAGTYEYDACFAVAVRPTDGAALLAGYSQGTWDGTANYNGYSAGVLLETGSEEATLAPVSSTTPSPVISATLSPVVSVTPSPFTITTPTAGTLSPQPAVTTNDDSSDTASVCGEGESFRIVSSELPGIQGCYEITSLTYADGGTMEAYTTDGMVDFEEIWVFGTIDDETEEPSAYYVAYASESDAQTHVYCISEEGSMDVHPADATWSCYLDNSGLPSLVTEDEVNFQCGCTGTPAPAAPTLAPVSTPVPVGAPVAASSSSSSSSVPLAPVIGGTLAGVALLAIVGIFVVKRRVGEDESFGRSPAAPNAAPPGVAVAAAATGKGGGHFAMAPPPPPPEYSEPPPPEADRAQADLPPPPYSEPPSYSG